MERLNISEQDIIKAFNEGKVIRKTSGIWNNPSKSGVIVESVKQLESFYNWAYKVDVYKGLNEGIDYDLVGASCGDMF